MYEQFYKFNAKPFHLTPDPRFFFPSRSHGKALAYLQYGLHQGEGMIVITGNVGTGKTTLVEALLNRIPDDKLFTVKLVSTQLESDDVLRIVAAAFGVSARDATKAGLLRDIEDFLLARAREGKRVLLLVDEAQNLNRSALEELRMLANFQLGESPLIQIFLIGQSEFKERLNQSDMEQFRQRVIASTHLLPLNDVNEVAGYIEHRLKLAGWQEDPKIAPDLYAVIQQVTDGIPRRINVLFEKLLVFSCLEGLHELTVASLREVMEQSGDEDFSPTRTSRPQREPERDASDEQSSPAPSASAANDIEQRLLVLERRMDDLDKRMRKLILMAFLSGEDADIRSMIDSLREFDEH